MPKYCCANCNDVFFEHQAPFISTINPKHDDKDYIVCPNCHSSDLVEVEDDTPVDSFYEEN